MGSPPGLISSLVQTQCVCVCVDESEAVAPIIWLYQIVDAQKEEVFFPELLITLRSYVVNRCLVYWQLCLHTILNIMKWIVKQAIQHISANKFWLPTEKNSVTSIPILSASRWPYIQTFEIIYTDPNHFYNFEVAFDCVVLRLIALSWHT